MPNYKDISKLRSGAPGMNLSQLEDLERLRKMQQAQQQQRMAADLLRQGAKGRTAAPMSLLDLVMKNAKPAGLGGLAALLYPSDVGDATIPQDEVVQDLPWRGYGDDERRKLPYNQGDLGLMMLLNN